MQFRYGFLTLSAWAPLVSMAVGMCACGEPIVGEAERLGELGRSVVPGDHISVVVNEDEKVRAQLLGGVTDHERFDGGAIEVEWRSDSVGLPDEAFLITREGDSAFLIFEPPPNVWGSAYAEVDLVLNGTRVGSWSVEIEIVPQDDAPTFEGIVSSVSNEDRSTVRLEFKINDIDTPLDRLEVSADSSTPGLASLEVSGTGEDWVLVLEAAEGAVGLTDIQLAVSDGHSTTQMPIAVVIVDSSAGN